MNLSKQTHATLYTVIDQLSTRRKWD